MDLVIPRYVCPSIIHSLADKSCQNITFRDSELQNVRLAWSLAQCTSYSGATGGCDTSQFQIEDMHWGNIQGTVQGKTVATLQCSAAAPCPGIELFNNTLESLGTNQTAYEYLCDNVVDTEGFECTGPCDGDCPQYVFRSCAVRKANADRLMQ